MYPLVATVCQFSISNRFLKNLAFRSYVVLLRNQRNDTTSALKKEDDTRVLKKKASEMKTRATWTAKNYRRIAMHRSRYVVFDRSQGDVIYVESCTPDRSFPFGKSNWCVDTILLWKRGNDSVCGDTFNRNGSLEMDLGRPLIRLKSVKPASFFGFRSRKSA